MWQILPSDEISPSSAIHFLSELKAKVHSAETLCDLNKQE
jgi:hypothetical protein